jgi:hypothetical protein
MTYLRRSAVLAILAPEADDGRAAQDRADQQSYQKPAQRAERLARVGMPPPASGCPEPAPGESGKRPGYTRIEQGRDGLLVGRWVSHAKELLNGRPEAWRREWLELHAAKVEQVRKARREWVDKLEALAIAPALAPMPGIAE